MIIVLRDWRKSIRSVYNSIFYQDYDYIFENKINTTTIRTSYKNFKALILTRFWGRASTSDWWVRGEARGGSRPLTSNQIHRSREGRAILFFLVPVRSRLAALFRRRRCAENFVAMVSSSQWEPLRSSFRNPRLCRRRPILPGSGYFERSTGDEGQPLRRGGRRGRKLRSRYEPCSWLLVGMQMVITCGDKLWGYLSLSIFLTGCYQLRERIGWFPISASF